MSYIDPDLLHGALNNLNTFVADNDEALTAKGLSTATVKAGIAAIDTDLSTKKTARDNRKTDLAKAQMDFATAAGPHYATFSDLIDTVAGALGKKSPAGKQVLKYRKHVLGGKRKAAAQLAPAAAPAK